LAITDPAQQQEHPVGVRGVTGLDQQRGRLGNQGIGARQRVERLMFERLMFKRWMFERLMFERR
jgi:hypothetical protein